MFYEMLTGRKPFDGTGLTDVLYNVVNQPTPAVQQFAPHVPRWCALYIERLLAKHPTERFLSAAVAAKELRRLLKVHRFTTGADQPDLGVMVEREITQDDTPTTPINLDRPGRRTLEIFDRHVPRHTAFGAIGAIVLVTGVTLYALMRQVDVQPATRIDHAQLSEFQEKRLSMQQAELLFAAGAFEQSSRLLRLHLAKFPESMAARELLDRSERARTASAVAAIEVRGQAHIAASAAKARAVRVAEKAPEPPPSLFARIRAFFTRQ
jgi:hypothetical protein